MTLHFLFTLCRYVADMFSDAPADIRGHVVADIVEEALRLGNRPSSGEYAGLHPRRTDEQQERIDDRIELALRASVLDGANETHSVGIDFLRTIRSNRMEPETVGACAIVFDIANGAVREFMVGKAKIVRSAIENGIGLLADTQSEGSDIREVYASAVFYSSALVDFIAEMGWKDYVRRPSRARVPSLAGRPVAAAVTDYETMRVGIARMLAFRDAFQAGLPAPAPWREYRRAVRLRVVAWNAWTAVAQRVYGTLYADDVDSPLGRFRNRSAIEEAFLRMKRGEAE